MNEIEKTIRLLSDMKLSFSQNYIQEAFDVSIEALREKQERESGCYKCQTKIFTNRLVAGKDGELFRYVELPHNYCPMCGKMVEDKP